MVFYRAAGRKASRVVLPSWEQKQKTGSKGFCTEINARGLWKKHMEWMCPFVELRADALSTACRVSVRRSCLVL